MSNDRPENPTPNQTGNIALDDMGIPILEEIVAPKADPKPETKTQAKISSEALKHNLSFPNNEILVKALKNRLRSKVKNDLDDIAKDVAAKAVSSITPELERMIRAQIIEILEQNLEQMINKAVSNLPNKK